ncbi:MAG: hypothetical protein JXR77_19320 [Lentisphaeria bacterium]|nr:hypothetical protein [Lentisphaeria bacterium]
MARQPGTERSYPLTLDSLREMGVFAHLTGAPAAADPARSSRVSYRIWLVQQNFSGGSLVLTREPTGAGMRLSVALDMAEYTGEVFRYRATIECDADALATPRSWTLESGTFDHADEPVPESQLRQTGKLDGANLTLISAGTTRQHRIPTPATSNWSLFEAVRRLPRTGVAPLEFTLIEDMDLVKPDQRLEFREETSITLGADAVPLRGYQQIGRGILPWQYWVDAHGSLLFAFSGLRAFVHDPDPAAWVQAKLASGRARRARLEKESE